MTISIQCVHCHKRYNAPAAMAGKKVKCKHCGKVFAIPAAGAEEGDLDLAPAGRESESSSTTPSPFKNRAPAAKSAAPGSGKIGDPSAGIGSRMARKADTTEIG